MKIRLLKNFTAFKRPLFKGEEYDGDFVDRLDVKYSVNKLVFEGIVEVVTPELVVFNEEIAMDHFPAIQEVEAKIKKRKGK